MGGKEQRRERRIKVEYLPDEYRCFSILLSHGKEIEVQTLDASMNGFGFLADLDTSNFVVSTHLVLYPLGNEHPVYGIIVHAQAAENKTRVGVQLQPMGGYRRYTEEMQKILEKFPEAQ
jgi:hypothetical protein